VPVWLIQAILIISLLMSSTVAISCPKDLDLDGLSYYLLVSFLLTGVVFSAVLRTWMALKLIVIRFIINKVF
jgi:hypothetical protein